ncbi:hypothetical protein D5018_16845 [Parashewanella curva]|uniref:Uncharacterized protein n=1 Tax=Parashewanella curva TaxID=2338552 RepID=A0A3L8PSX3_9GAMM|nr:hypothetical protein D5018_16845 [Parashewanella curva]
MTSYHDFSLTFMPCRGFGFGGRGAKVTCFFAGIALGAAINSLSLILGFKLRIHKFGCINTVNYVFL